MSIGLRLDLRQTQQLVMTPQLQQAIRLLAMSNLELADFVTEEVEKNPLLDVAGPEERDIAPDETPVPAVDPEDGTPAATDTLAEDHGLLGETFDCGAENLHDSSPSDGPDPFGDEPRLRTQSAGHGLSDVSERIAERVDLRSHLRAQLGQMPGSDSVAGRIALYLVDELDEHGYLRPPLQEIADRLGTSEAQVRQGLARLQDCSPTGVGARGVAECMALQLAERNRLDPAMAALIDNLDLIARGDLRQLRTKCGVDAEDFSDMLGELRTLDPRPCAAFVTEEPETLIPDILLRRTSWGAWSVELNPDTLPKVLIDRTYRSEMVRGGCPETQKFLTDCHASANWLIKSLDQRARTILRVATEIVRHQERFFSEGISGLQPLTLREVADAIGMHESTASRVTSNKYIATERGILELKFFFTNAVGNGSGDVAATVVRHRIKALVAEESRTGVLSDDSIVDILRSEGVDIARRTVAKYRKSLNIPSSVVRRRQQAVSARM